MSQTLRKISEKKLIKEVETNFKLVGILFGVGWPMVHQLELARPARGSEDLSF